MEDPGTHLAQRKHARQRAEGRSRSLQTPITKGCDALYSWSDGNGHLLAHGEADLTTTSIALRI